MDDMKKCKCGEVATLNLTWVNVSIGPQETGPSCENCVISVWKQLAKYPDAYQTSTLNELEVTI